MQQLLSHLIKQGVRFSTSSDGELKIQLGRYKLTETEKTAVKNVKADILAFLAGGKAACLSYAQERLWFLAELGFSAQYHVPAFGRIRGDLNSDALERALNACVARHDSLRTHFTTLNNVPVQRVHPATSLVLETLDLSALPEQGQQQKQAMQTFLERPFDLEQDSLFRAILLILSPQQHILGLCMHHIITDGWSMRILLRDLTEAYQRFCMGQLPHWEALALDYCTYAVWERDIQTEQRFSRDVAYWKDQLSGYSNLALPLDYIRPAQLSGHGGYVQFELSQTQGARIKHVSRERNTTAFTLFMAAVYTLLRTYSNQTDICMGMPVANRQQRELEDLIGFFVNTLVMRIQLPDDPSLTVDALLKQVHQVIVEGQDHQTLPIEKVLELLQPERDLSRSPIFQVLINYTPLSLGKVPFGACSLEPLFDFDIKEAKFDLTFTYNEFEDGHASIGIEYASDLFREESIAAMSSHLARLLDCFTATPKLPLADISLLDSKARDLHLQQGRGKRVAYPQDRCLHDLINAQAARTPDHLAVCYAQEHLTYRQLQQQSQQLALYLQQQGVVPDCIVALCLPRSLDMIVALLGILSSGGAYLPIDASTPVARIKTLVQDSGAPLLITRQELANDLNSLSEIPCRMICMDTDRSSIDKAQGELTRQVTPQHLAYVIYTSGSTGQPKGVMIEHRSVINHNYAVIDAYRLTAADRVLQFSTISFDIFVEEVFPTLLSGGAVILLDGTRYTDPAYLKAILKQHGVTLINLPTAYWHTLAGEHFSDTALSRVIIGGEKAEIDRFHTWQQHNPGIQVINTYGPTETTVIALLHPIAPDQAVDRPIPLGKPLANTDLYILDPQLNLVPVGIPGELHIAGAGLARGYLNSPDLTREKFIDNPYIPGTRLYKTGDMARWLPNGLVEFGGRRDDQVKIRGFRVELGEIEAAMAAYPGVQAAVVLVKSQQNIKQLIAFYTVAEGQSVPSEALKASLQQRLPDYMLPLAFEKLDSLPLTASGKLDRKQLAQRTVRLNDQNGFTAAQTEREQQLVNLWKELLGIERVGIHDNFFELGGHSLLTLQLVNRINATLDGAAVSVADIFKYPSIDLLLNYLDRNAPNVTASPYIVPLRDSIPTFIVPGMPGLSDGYVELAASWPQDGPVYGLQMQGYAGDQPASTVAEMAAHQLAQIQRIQPQGKIHLVAHSYGGTVVYEMLQQLQKTALQVGNIVFIDSGLLSRQPTVDKASVTAFCHFMLTNAGSDPETVKHEIARILEQQPYVLWKEHLAALLQKTNPALDAGQFIKIWQVIEASITAAYDYQAKLPYTLTLVIAEGSKRWLKPNSWAAYFDQVNVIHAQGEHFTVVRKPYCDRWLQQLSPSTMNANLANSRVLADGIILSVRQLEKHYPGVQAVKQVSFDIRQGCCFGLLGPNGAGKTTTLEMLEGITKPSQGEIRFRGVPIDKHYTTHIGIQFQHTALPESLTVKESLQLFGNLYKNRLPLEEVIEACALQEFLNRDNRKLSGGQRQRLLLAIALINDPDILFLDEPTTGLDPHSRHNFWNVIRQIKQRGKTIILTTHYMEEAEQLCDEIAIMDHGKILVQDKPAQLLEQHFAGVVIRLPESSGLATRSDVPFEVYAQGDWVEFITANVEDAIRHLTQQQIPLDGLSVASPNLENLFLKLTGHALRT